LRSNRDLTFKTQVHSGARHGYALPDRDVHDRAATEADWANIFAMFRRQLLA
jgi:carboxymethylenebutenolidase